MNEAFKTYVAEAKRYLRAQGNFAAGFTGVKDAMRAEVEVIRDADAKGGSVIPELSYASIAAGTVTDAQRTDIRHRGCAVIRGVFPRATAEGWNAELGDYIADNDYVKRSQEKAGLDQYFSGLDAGAPQIFGLYWSRPQVMARQDPAMAATKRFMNRLWDVAGPMGDEFDPDHARVVAGD